MTDHLKEDVDYMGWAIRSGIAGLIVILLALVGWLATGRDATVLGAIKTLSEAQIKGQDEARANDQKIMDSLNKICDRLGVVEGRVSNLEIFIQMPYPQRQKLFESFRPKLNSSQGNGVGK